MLRSRNTPAPSPIPTHDLLSIELKAYIDLAVIRALRDPVRRRDFALYADGGRAVPQLTGVIHDGQISSDSQQTSLKDWGPNAALTDDMRVGQCWRVPSSAAQLGFRLTEKIHPTHVTIDHIPREIAADIGEAPRQMMLWGLVDGALNEQRLRKVPEVLTSTLPTFLERQQPLLLEPHVSAVILATFEYDIYDPSPIQTFPVEPYVLDSFLHFGVLILDVASNWGSSSMCLYRIRVHGNPAAV